MQFLADECCDAVVTRTLREAGYDVIAVAEAMSGSTDAVVLQRALDEERVILTEDRDFCELIFRDRKQTYGIVLIRISDTERQEKASRILALVANHADALPHAMTTLTVNAIRIRSLLEKPPEESEP
jgi:predicted nuclease of predicted toxin-antitoxin system